MIVLELAAQEALLPSAEALPFGPEEAAWAAELYQAVPRPRGREIDLAVAACALSWNGALWTLNTRDFEDVDIPRARSPVVSVGSSPGRDGSARRRRSRHEGRS